MDFLIPWLHGDFLSHPVWMWLVFAAVVVVLLALDLGVLHRDDREIGLRESLKLSAGYITVALAFGGWIAWTTGADAGIAYVTGFLVEKSLSMDNVFVIALVFASLGIPRALQHRVLFWGILGVIVLRGVMIAAGAALVSSFSWALPLFGVFLVYAGLKMLKAPAPGEAREEPALIGFLRRHLRVTPGLHGSRFLVRLPDPATGRARWWATPLLLALLVVEAVDVVFAVDSVPAIFAVTQDPFLVYTSNIFAILGLRALYFALSALVDKFRYLHVALAAVLVFIGGKILAAEWIGHLPAWLSLGVTASLLAAGVIASIAANRRDAREPELPLEPDEDEAVVAPAQRRLPT